MNGWTKERYAMFRIIFGTYLTIHFAGLLPWAAELFSGAGMMPADVSPLIGIFPNPLGWVEAPWFASAFVGLGLILSVLFTAGVRDRVAAVAIWFIWACLLGRAPLISNPGIPFVGWLLLVHAAVPTPKGQEWRLPKPFFALAWVLMAVGYTYSGVTKLISPSWFDGSALWYVLESPLARPTVLREWLVGQESLLRVLTFGVLALEVLFAPLAAFKRFRPWLWLAMVMMHLGILVTVDFADLTMGMLMVHIITFDPEWLPTKRSSTKVIGTLTRGASAGVP